MFKNEDKGEGPKKRLLPPFVFSEYTEWLRLSCISLVLFITGIYVPVAGVAIALASPVPISLIGLRQGAFKASLAAALASAVMFLPFGEVGAVTFVLSVGFLGVIFSIAVRRIKSAGEAIFALILVSLVSKLVFMWLMTSIGGQNPFMLDEASLKELMSSFSAGDASEDILKSVTQQMSRLIPSFLIMASGVDVFVCYLLTSNIEGRRLRNSGADGEFKIPALPPFSEWFFPRSLLTAFFTALIIGLLDASESSKVLMSAEINLKILTSVMFFIQGLSFAWWLMLRRNFSHSARIAIFIILLFVPIFSMGLIIMGIVDIIVNLRRKVRRNI